MVTNSKDEIPKEVLESFMARKGNTMTSVFFYFMKELNLSASEIMAMPISRMNVLLLELRDHNKRQEQEMKKVNKK